MSWAERWLWLLVLVVILAVAASWPVARPLSLDEELLRRFLRSGE